MLAISLNMPFISDVKGYLVTSLASVHWLVIFFCYVHFLVQIILQHIARTDWSNIPENSISYYIGNI